MEGAAFFMTQLVKCIFRLMVDTVRSGGERGRRDRLCPIDTSLCNMVFRLAENTCPLMSVKKLVYNCM